MTSPRMNDGQFPRFADAHLDQFAADFPQFDLRAETLPRIRHNAFKAAFTPSATRYQALRLEHQIPSTQQHTLRLVEYRPQGCEEPIEHVFLHFHGGGYIIGQPEDAEEQNLWLVQQLYHQYGLAIRIISVDYRLAPEHPYPAALDDAFTALSWCLHTQGVTENKLVIGGESAGGGLAATLAIKARDHNIDLAGQLLIYPMLDPTASSNKNDRNTAYAVWTPDNNQCAWHAYLGDTIFAETVIPGEHVSLTKVAPAWIAVGEDDLFYTENREYSLRLEQANVQQRFTGYAKAFHGFDRALESPLAQQFRNDLAATLAQMLLNADNPLTIGDCDENPVST
ncbi:alpha/beta hydrolase [Alteromonas oceanisediminis]|uniref:alpha/beta hydrolase n=1 Tax=Alteromonas oceanisediminis TaxID=2836180 RepID=UPI001BD99681|nr:alpha/beta hydrolase [Alteromonas oceanisediminis]MBT0586262.1 alpha/beta hydrolase [Alteromonas oceanisediminis]